MNLYLYDESHKDENNIYLTNLIDTVNYKGVRLSTPAGVVRIAEKGQFITHIKFEYSGLEIVCKINDFVYVNDNAIDYSYTIDGIKTFFANYTYDKLTGVKTLSSVTYNPFIKSNLIPVKGETTRLFTTGAISVNNRFCVVVKNKSTADLYNSTSVYILTPLQLTALTSAIVSHEHANIIRPQIVNIFYLPFYDEFIAQHSNIIQSGVSIPVYTDYKQNNVIDIITGVSIIKSTGLYGVMSVNTNVSTNIEITCTNYLDFAPYTAYYLYIPFCGVVSLNIEQLITEINHTITPILTFSYDLISGTISAKFTGLTNSATAYHKLPSVDLPINEGENAQYMTSFNSMAQIGTSLLMGNPAGVVAGVSNFVTGSVQNEFRPATSGNVTSDGGLFNYHFELTTIKHIPTITFNDYVSEHGYLCNQKIYSGNAPVTGELFTVDVEHINARLPYKDLIINDFKNKLLTA